jgi:flagellar biosynthesis GTPase FlhF
MHYFTEHGDTHAEVLAKVRNKYGSGPEVLISQQREVPVKSIWGKITRSTRWEIHGAILEKNKVQPKKKDETIDNKLKLLEEMLNRTSAARKTGIAPALSGVEGMVSPEELRLPQGNKFELSPFAGQQLTREIHPSLRKEILPISVQPPSAEQIRRLEAEVAELKAQLKSKGRARPRPCERARAFVALRTSRRDWVPAMTYRRVLRCARAPKFLRRITSCGKKSTRRPARFWANMYARQPPPRSALLPLSGRRARVKQRRS